MLAGIGATLVVALASCIAPTLPVPPPSEPESVTLDTKTGLVTVVGKRASVQGGAEVNLTNWTAFNERCDPKVHTIDCDYKVSTKANPDGSFVIDIWGRSKDELWLTQSVSGGESAPFVFRVP